MAKKAKVRLVLACLVLAALTLLILPIYGEYGGHNLSLAIIRYMERNDGRWPSTWNDIEPYHKDPLLPIRSTVIVRQFWDVNWNVEPHQLHAESRVEPRPRISIETGVWPVVFNQNWYPKDRPVTRWVLSPLLQRHLDKKKEEEERSTSGTSDPLPR